MKRTFLKSLMCVAVSVCMLVCSAASFGAAKNPKISRTSKSIKAGKTFTLRVTNPGKKVKWSSSNKKVAKITGKSGTKNGRARIKALKKGTATITAKIGNRKLKCKITVKKKSGAKKSTDNTTVKSNASSGTMVYISDTGTKYHYYWCPCLKSQNLVPLSWAQQNGYEPCKVCHK